MDFQIRLVPKGAGEEVGFDAKRAVNARVFTAGLPTCTMLSDLRRRAVIRLPELVAMRFCAEVCSELTC